MTIRLVLAACAFMLCGACGEVTDDQPLAASLPFYDSVDLTPRWTQTVDHHLGPFALVTQTGAPLTDRDLLGRIHVASFMFTRCSGICPTMVKQLGQVQDALVSSSDVVLVSYSVTPNLDRPADLAAFGAASGIDPSRWLLVTGDASQIYTLAHEFYFADDRRLRAPTSPTDEFLHTEKVLLVDRQGRLRGVYNGTQAFDMERLVEDIHTLEGTS